jgi:hypothetical protein
LIVDILCVFSVIINSGIYFLQKCVVSSDFENSARTYLTEFLNDGEKSQMPLPTGLTAQEELCIRQIAQQLGLIIHLQERRGEKVICVSKPEPE